VGEFGESMLVLANCGKGVTRAAIEWCVKAADRD
jgi:hypothetical protein